MKFYLVSSFIVFIYTTSFCQNTFYADQNENTIYSTDLEINSPMYFDINGDNSYDMELYMTWESNGSGYTDYNYLIKPINNFEIVSGTFSPNTIIYPNNYIWGDSSSKIAEENYVNGMPYFGWISTTDHIFARNIIATDTIYSWIQIGSWDSFFWATASWTPCLNKIEIGIDTTINHGDSIVLNAGDGYAYYLWNTGDTTESIIVNTEDFGTGFWTFSVVAGTEFCEYTDTINITILTVKPVYFEDKLIVFSNVGNNGFTIKSLNGERIESLVLFNELGQVILKEKPNSNIVNISNVKRGLYILEVSSKTWIARKKLVQQ